MTMISEELLPCPFCGCDDIGTESTATDGSVWCRGCRARIVCKHWPRDDRGQTDAIAAWNARTSPPPSGEAGEVTDRRLYELHVDALSEIKATVDGESDQSVKDIIYGLLAEIDALPTIKEPTDGN